MEFESTFKAIVAIVAFLGSVYGLGKAILSPYNTRLEKNTEIAEKQLKATQTNNEELRALNIHMEYMKKDNENRDKILNDHNTRITVNTSDISKLKNTIFAKERV